MADIVKLIYKGDEMTQGGGSSELWLTVVPVNARSNSITEPGTQASVSYRVPKAWFIKYFWTETIVDWVPANRIYIDTDNTTSAYVWELTHTRESSEYSLSTYKWRVTREWFIAVWPWTISLTISIGSDISSSIPSSAIIIDSFFYFG